MKQCWAAAMSWFERQRAMLVHVGTTLGVVTCLLLVIWLWGRPRGYMVSATRVAASSTAPVPAAAVPTPAVPAAAVKAEPAETESVSSPTAETPAEANTAPTPAAPTPAEANVGPQVGSEDEPASEVRTVATKVNVAKRADYTAPPWIKWYDEDGAEDAAPRAATAGKAQASVAVGSAGESAAKGAPAAKDTAR